MKKLIIILSFILTSILSLAQPANDNCSNATLITLPTPSACPSGVGSITNVTGTNASLYVSIANNPTWGSGTAYYIAYNITVPPTSSIIVIDRTNYFYVTENQSVGVQSGTASALVFVASFEVIT